MLYQALQPCRFDREYLTGDFISGQVILIDMVDKLIAWGLISPINDRDVERALQAAAARLQLLSKEQLYTELQRVTEGIPNKRWGKPKLIEMILKAQVGDGYEQNISI